jgi:PIN domain nuclease of toxin-antitoxin system
VKLLLDTHILLWAAFDDARLPSTARALISDNANELFFSAASLWEITIKRSQGRADFQVQARVLRRGLLDSGYMELPITSRHAMDTDLLPAIHEDPFDRILMAQALAEGILLLTADPILARYPGPVRLV